MISAASSTTSPQSKTPLQRGYQYLDKLGKLKLWSGVMAMQSLQRTSDEQSRNQEAESAHVRKTVWGADGRVGTGDDMGHTFLGDVTFQPPPPVQSPSQLGKILLGAGLLATGIGVPAGAWMLASGAKDAIVKPSDPPPVSVPTEKSHEADGVKVWRNKLRLVK